jgi:hypothetical protein
MIFNCCPTKKESVCMQNFYPPLPLPRLPKPLAASKAGGDLYKVQHFLSGFYSGNGLIAV